MFTPKQAADELSSVEELSDLHSSSNLFQALYRLQSEWRSRPGPWIETARETPCRNGYEVNQVVQVTDGECQWREEAGKVVPGTPMRWWAPLLPLPHPRSYTPTPEEINALPGRLRRWIHDLETSCDPAGEIRELHRLREENASLRALLEERGS